MLSYLILRSQRFLSRETVERWLLLSGSDFRLGVMERGTMEKWLSIEFLSTLRASSKMNEGFLLRSQKISSWFLIVREGPTKNRRKVGHSARN